MTILHIFRLQKYVRKHDVWNSETNTIQIQLSQLKIMEKIDQFEPPFEHSDTQGHHQTNFLVLCDTAVLFDVHPRCSFRSGCAESF